MADSEDITKPPHLQEGVTALVVVRKDGTSRSLLKGADGKFVRKARPLIATEEFIRARRKRMMKTNESGLTEDMSIVEELLAIIHTPIETDAKSGLPDAKFAMAKVKAAETLWLFTNGKPDPSEREMNKLERQPITAYFVQAPEIMNPEVVDGDKVDHKPKQPTFAEVTGVETNPKK
jgi:hypothetical protein